MEDRTAVLENRLIRPTHPVDVVIDTDAFNEIDDLYAIAYLLQSTDMLNTQAILAAPFYSPKSLGRFRIMESPAGGMEASYDAIMELLGVIGDRQIKQRVFKGARTFLKDEKTPVDSPAVQELLRLSENHSSDNPLYVAAIAALPDIASAILIDPTITERIVVTWLGGNALEEGTCSDFNASQDIAAMRVLFGSGVPVVQLPNKGVVSDFSFTRSEFIDAMDGKNRVCDYLLRTTLTYMSEKCGDTEWDKVLWDITPVAWIIDGAFMTDRLIPAPVPEYDLSYSFDQTRHPICYVDHINKAALAKDLFIKLGRY